MAKTQEQKLKEAEVPPPRRNWPDAVGRDTSGIGKGVFAKAGFRDPVLVLRWNEIAGAEVARIAQPVRLAEGPSGGVLTLKAEPGAALFLQHEGRILCERINRFLGVPAVAKLKIVQGPLGQRPAPGPRRRRAGHLSANDPALGCRFPQALRDAVLRLAAARTEEA